MLPDSLRKSIEARAHRRGFQPAWQAAFERWTEVNPERLARLVVPSADVDAELDAAATDLGRIRALCIANTHLYGRAFGMVCSGAPLADALRVFDDEVTP
jgi:hypothetical protein